VQGGSRKLQATEILEADELGAVVAYRASSQAAMNLIDRYRLHDMPPSFDPESRTALASARSTPIRCADGAAQLLVEVEVYARFGSTSSSS
jgi:hypothetical protein